MKKLPTNTEHWHPVPNPSGDNDLHLFLYPATVLGQVSACGVVARPSGPVLEATTLRGTRCVRCIHMWNRIASARAAKLKERYDGEERLGR